MSAFTALLTPYVHGLVVVCLSVSRQGDPGATRFFLSIEDDIFRIFGGDKVRSHHKNTQINSSAPDHPLFLPSPSTSPWLSFLDH
jgi:hypothetical protein